MAELVVMTFGKEIDGTLKTVISVSCIILFGVEEEIYQGTKNSKMMINIFRKSTSIRRTEPWANASHQ